MIVEPVAANMGVVPPAPGFLEGLRDLCDRAGALLIFDEVITGFRLARAARRSGSGSRPTSPRSARSSAAGFPLAAFGGRADVMERLAPAGPVYQAGTLSGNPVAVAAGIAALDLDRARAARTSAWSGTPGACAGCIGASPGRDARVNRAGSLFCVFFGADEVTDYDRRSGADHARYAEFFHGMLAEGVLLPPSGYEGWFWSAAHSDEHAERSRGRRRAGHFAIGW